MREYVLRGGSWNFNSGYLRASYRGSDRWVDDFGFRIVQDHGRKSSYGGSWMDFERDLVISNPYDLIVWNCEGYLGFRVVRNE